VRKQTIKAIVIGMAMLVSFAAPSMVGAADLEQRIRSVDPGIMERSIQVRPESRPHPMPEIVISRDEAGRLEGAEGVEFELTGVIFDGNEVFADEELLARVDQYLGLILQVNQLQQLADHITAYYHKHGYILTRAYLPPQTIAGGKVVIAITEGRLGAVIVEGNDRYKAEMIRKVMRVVRKQGALTGGSLERGMLVLNDYPGLDARATLVRGKVPGTTDIVVQVEEAKWWLVGLDYNNFGSAYVAEHRLGANLTLFNPFGIGDYLSLRYMGSANFSDKAGPMWYLRADYNLPLNTHGTRLGFALSRMHYEVGGPLQVLDLDGTSDLLSTWISHPFIRTRNFSLWGDAGLDLKRISSKMFGVKLYEEDMFNARLGGHTEWLDGLWGRNMADLNVIKGMEDDTPTSRLWADSKFLKLEGSYRRFQDFPGRFSGLLSLQGQYATDRVPTAEQFAIGGATTVRGYGQGDYSGDHGMAGTFELRYLIYTEEMDWQAPSGSRGNFAIEGVGFLDHGRVWTKDAFAAELSDARLWGAGVGARFAYSPYAMAKIEWAKAISGDRPLSEGTFSRGAWYLLLSLVY